MFVKFVIQVWHYNSMHMQTDNIQIDIEIPEKLKPCVAEFGEWVSRGLYFGYPTCCIYAFCNRFRGALKPLTSAQEKVHNYKGFIPCHKCSKKIVSGKITIKDLISRKRKCPKPYPKD